jgi:hypothetical protein
MVIKTKSASRHFQGQTLHSFAGIGMGDGPVEMVRAHAPFFS